jgi:pyruvate,water dikinase
VVDPSDPPDLEPGDIIVAPLTDPAWTPLFMAVDGVVVNVGGQISHAVIVSRELGLPCVVSVPDATELIQDGTQIEVNGNTGQVTVIEG